MQRGKTRLSEHAGICARILAGTVIDAIGFQYFMYPNAIISGGVTGISMIINFLSGMPVGLMTILLNIPLFLFSWKKFGLRFLIYSLLGMLLFSVSIDVFAMFPLAITRDPLLGSIYGGVISGLGCGILYQTGATTGGVDIIAKYLRKKYPYINFSTFLLILDLVVFLLFAVIFQRYDSAMYALIRMFISAKVIDVVLVGAVNSKVCYVITDKNVELKDAIVTRLQRGVTYLHGEGAWSGKEKDVILCVIKSRQIVELRRIIEDIDPGAFLIVSDSREVFGKGFAFIGDES